MERKTQALSTHECVAEMGEFWDEPVEFLYSIREHITQV